MTSTKVHKTLQKSLLLTQVPLIFFYVLSLFKPSFRALPLTLHREACALTLQTMSIKRCLTDQDCGGRNRKSTGTVGQRVVLGLGSRGRQGLHASHPSYKQLALSPVLLVA